MDPAMTQMLVERLGLSKEDLNTIQGGDLPSSLASRFSSDPLMAMLVNSMTRPNTVDSEPLKQRIPPDRALTSARQTIRDLREDLTAAKVMLNYFAELFGACAFCWGQSRSCPSCKGAGVPGSDPPKEAELLAWVEPALEKLGMRVVKIE